MSLNRTGLFKRQRLIGYLKPNFSHYILNYLIVFCLGIGSFSFASLAVAFEDDGTWQSGSFYCAAMGSGSCGPTKSAACSTLTRFSGFTDTSVSGGQCKYLYNQTYSYVNFNILDCSTSTLWGCTESPTPPNNCPEYGTLKKVSKLINGTIENGTFIPRDPNAGTVIQIGGGASVDGCGYAVPIGENIPANMPVIDKPITCKQDDAGNMLCYKDQYMIATGEQLAADPNGVYSEAQSDPNDPATDPTSGSSTNLIESTEDHFKGAAEVIEYEGVASTRTTNVDTEVKEKGARVVDSDSTSVITMSDGIQKTVTTTTTLVEYPDGSKKEIVDSTTGYTATPKTQFVIDKSTGTVSISVQPGSSASASSTTTNQYDADGNLIGSSTTSSTDGSGDAADEQNAEKCKEDPNAAGCEKKYSGPSGEGEYTPVADLSFSTIIDGFSTRVGASPIASAVDGFFELSLSGSCPTWSTSFDIMGYSFDIVIDHFCLPEMQSIYTICGVIVLLVGSWLAFRIAIL